jgi:phage terminase small subunit
MRRGPKRRPSVILDLHGTRRQRHKEQPPDAVATGTLDEPPDDLTDAEKACWRHAIANAPAGILSTIDTSLLRLWAVAEARFLAAKEAQAKLDAASQLPLLIKTRSGDLVPSPYIGIMSKSTTLMLRMVEQLGFSPTARVGLGQGDESDGADEEDNRWLRLEAMRRKAANA